MKLGQTSPRERKGQANIDQWVKSSKGSSSIVVIVVLSLIVYEKKFFSIFFSYLALFLGRCVYKKLFVFVHIYRLVCFLAGVEKSRPGHHL